MEHPNDFPEKGERRFGQLKHFVLAFVLAAAGYASLFYLIEGARVKSRPWQVTFTRELDGTPVLVVRQNKAAPEPRKIIFKGQPVLAETETRSVEFDTAKPVPFPVPFGKCLFLDTTFLPGTVVLELFGHTVELMPKALIIDNRDYPWRSGFSEVQVVEQSAPAH